MSTIQIQSVATGYEHAALLRPLLSLLSKVSAMGFLRGKRISELNAKALRTVLDALNDDGLAPHQRLNLKPLLDSPSSPEAIERALPALRELLETLEESPAPKQEWPAMLDVFGEEELGKLVGVSTASVKRYAAGLRTTPDNVADRLHYLAMLVADLSGSYNELGIRRWFERPRAQLDDRSPRQLLGPRFRPGAPSARRVRELARALAAGGAT